MGATFDMVTIAPCSVEQLKKKFSQVQEDYCDQYGTDTYAGHIGIAPGLSVSSKKFKTTGDAEEWLHNNAEKWEPAIAVQVGDFTKVFPKTESDKKLATLFAQTEATINNWDTDIIKRVKAGKSQQRACPKCASKITVSFITTNACPVCHDDKFLQTETDNKKLATLKTKYTELKDKIEQAKQKYSEKNDTTYWVVGAWCAE